LFTPEIDLFIVAFLVGFASSFCSLAEASIVALTDFHVKTIGEKNPKLAKKLKKIIKNKPKFLSSIIMFNTVVNIGGSMFVGSIAASLYDENQYFYFVLSMTLLMLLFSEIKPKVFAAKNPDSVIKYINLPIIITTWLLTPIVNAVNGFLNNNSADDELNIEELNHFVSTAAESGLIKKDEASIIKNVVELRAKTSDIIVKNEAITMMSVSDIINDKKEELLNTKFRRIILVNTELKPVGMFYKEDALKKIILGESDLPLSSIMHPLPVVDPKCSVTVLARRLQKTGGHLAVVVDDDGLTLGVVSLTDVKGLIFS